MLSEDLKSIYGNLKKSFPIAGRLYFVYTVARFMGMYIFPLYMRRSLKVEKGARRVSLLLSFSEGKIVFLNRKKDIFGKNR